jgi:hypothetical protein
MTPDLGVRACVRTLSPPNLDIFTQIPKDPIFLFTPFHGLIVIVWLLGSHLWEDGYGF